MENSARKKWVIGFLLFSSVIVNLIFLMYAFVQKLEAETLRNSDVEVQSAAVKRDEFRRNEIELLQDSISVLNTELTLLKQKK